MSVSVRHAGYRAPVTVAFSAHAVARYIERVRPGMNYERAAAELELMAEAGVVLPGPPLWARSTRFFPHLVIADVVFPLTPDREEPAVLVACTCLVRGMRPVNHRGRRASRTRRRVAPLIGSIDEAA